MRLWGECTDGVFRLWDGGLIAAGLEKEVRKVAVSRFGKAGAEALRHPNVLQFSAASGGDEAAEEKEAVKAAAKDIEEASKGGAIAILLDESSISELEDALATGEWDDCLAEMEAVEKAGKNRKGALEAISDRAGEVAGGE